jgi:serine acetyltransferase
LRDRIKIGGKPTVGSASFVTKDISDDVTIMGSPAREVSKQKQPLRLWLK